MSILVARINAIKPNEIVNINTEIMVNNNNNQNNWVPPKEWTPNIPEVATVSYYYPEEEISITPLIQDGV